VAWYIPSAPYNIVLSCKLLIAVEAEEDNTCRLLLKVCKLLVVTVDNDSSFPFIIPDKVLRLLLAEVEILLRCSERVFHPAEIDEDRFISLVFVVYSCPPVIASSEFSLISPASALLIFCGVLLVSS